MRRPFSHYFCSPFSWDGCSYFYFHCSWLTVHWFWWMGHLFLAHRIDQLLGASRLWVFGCLQKWDSSQRERREVSQQDPPSYPCALHPPSGHSTDHFLQDILTFLLLLCLWIPGLFGHSQTLSPQGKWVQAKGGRDPTPTMVVIFQRIMTRDSEHLAVIQLIVGRTLLNSQGNMTGFAASHSTALHSCWNHRT